MPSKSPPLKGGQSRPGRAGLQMQHHSGRGIGTGVILALHQGEGLGGGQGRAIVQRQGRLQPQGVAQAAPPAGKGLGRLLVDAFPGQQLWPPLGGEALRQGLGKAAKLRVLPITKPQDGHGDGGRGGGPLLCQLAQHVAGVVGGPDQRHRWPPK